MINPGADNLDRGPPVAKRTRVRKSPAFSHEALQECAAALEQTSDISESDISNGLAGAMAAYGAAYNALLKVHPRVTHADIDRLAWREASYYMKWSLIEASPKCAPEIFYHLARIVTRTTRNKGSSPSRC